MRKRRVPSSRFRDIRMLILDVDGVLTDGGMYYTESGDEFKRFDTRDGQGIALIAAAGIVPALITRERTSIVTRRAKKLGITEVHQGATDKLSVVKDLLSRHGIEPHQACYIGDDIGDLAAMRFVGVPVAVPDAAPAVRRAAAFITRRKGGYGAVREVCELIISARRRRTS